MRQANRVYGPTENAFTWTALLYRLKQQLKFRWRNLWVDNPLIRRKFAFRMIYWFRDPWNYAKRSETFRFQSTHDILAVHKPFDSILEIGSAEGHLSCFLTRLTANLVGVDFSGTACRRAAKRVPKGKFKRTGFREYAASLPDNAFDCIVACEVIYYFDDPKFAVSEMIRIGRRGLFTYARSQPSDFIRFLREATAVSDLEFANSHWVAVMWEKRTVNDPAKDAMET